MLENVIVFQKDLKRLESWAWVIGMGRHGGAGYVPPDIGPHLPLGGEHQPVLPLRRAGSIFGFAANASPVGKQPVEDSPSPGRRSASRNPQSQEAQVIHG